MGATTSFDIAVQGAAVLASTIIIAVVALEVLRFVLRYGAPFAFGLWMAAWHSRSCQRCRLGLATDWPDMWCKRAKDFAARVRP